MNYIDGMQSLATEGLDRLFRGATSVAFVDFPDYANVGDSAIALGHLRYLDERSINVKSITAIGTLHRKRLNESDVVLINGGGNIGGLYPLIDEHRHDVADCVRSESMLIQGPQSVSFVDKKIERDFTEKVLQRENTRIGARDQGALRLLNGGRAEVHLVPDAAHLLGAIECELPSQRVLVLAREDKEAKISGSARFHGSVDWLRDDAAARWMSRLRWRSSRFGSLGPLLNPTAERWERIAEGRLKRGIRILERGEVVVTDRLHGMLLALQMGRSVVCVDNNNGKLSRYADAWFGANEPNVMFARDFESGVRLAMSGKVD